MCAGHVLRVEFSFHPVLSQVTESGHIRATAKEGSAGHFHPRGRGEHGLRRRHCIT